MKLYLWRVMTSKPFNENSTVYKNVTFGIFKKYNELLHLHFYSSEGTQAFKDGLNLASTRYRIIFEIFRDIQILSMNAIRDLLVSGTAKPTFSKNLPLLHPQEKKERKKKETSVSHRQSTRSLPLSPPRAHDSPPAAPPPAPAPAAAAMNTRPVMLVLLLIVLIITSQVEWKQQIGDAADPAAARRRQQVLAKEDAVKEKVSTPKKILV